MATKTKTIQGADAVIVLVKDEWDDKPRPVTLHSGDELPDNLFKGEDKKLEALGVFDPDNALKFRDSIRQTYQDRAENDPDVARIAQAVPPMMPSSADEASRQQIMAQVEHAKESEKAAEKASKDAEKADKEAQKAGKSSGAPVLTPEPVEPPKTV